MKRSDMSGMSEEEMDVWFRARAKELYYKDGEIEVDSNAIISYGDDAGAYVAAWVWVPLEEEQEEEDNDS
jgi:hypothetical protein